MTTELIFPGRIAGMNGKGGLIRTHWTQKKKMKEQYLWMVRQQTKNQHPGTVRLELIRHSAGVEMDYDNLVATGKNLVDSIVEAGVIKDDKQSIIIERDYRQVKCKILDQKTVIRITDVTITEAERRREYDLQKMQPYH